MRMLEKVKDLLGLNDRRARFLGDYASFESALKDCEHAEGYESDNIVAVASQRAVKIRKAAEGNPVGCGQSSSRQLAAFLPVMLSRRQASELRVLDFGGSLGWHFFRLGKFLSLHRKLRWDIVETAPMSAEGNRLFKTDVLTFFDSLDQVRGSKYDVVLASGSLQYVKDPIGTFKRLADVGSDFMIFDTVPFVEREMDRLTVQITPGVSNPSYPSWFFGRSSWMKRFDEMNYRIIMRWKHHEAELVLDRQATAYEGFLLERRR